MPEPIKAKGLILPHRGVLRISGPDRVTFLQGLVSNDIDAVSPTQSIWSAFLTAQGKFLHEFFVTEAPAGAGTDEKTASEGALLIDCEAERLADLQRRLKLYKLRSQVQLEDVQSMYSVVALFGDAALPALNLEKSTGKSADLAEGRVFVDPRLSEMGARAILPVETVEAVVSGAGFEFVSLAEYDHLRSELGVPDGSRDLEIEKSILLENGFDELHGVDWDKGCYMGQELTARTKYRGLIKKRLMPVEISGTAPAPGTPLLIEGKEVGVMRSAADSRGLATVRLKALQETDSLEMHAGETKIVARKPSWMKT